LFSVLQKKIRIQKLALYILCSNFEQRDDYINITMTGVTGVRQKKAEYAKLKEIYR